MDEKDDLPTPGAAARDELADLVSSVRVTLAAELGYWRTRLDYTRGKARQIAVLMGIAISFATGAVLALIFGVLLVLNPIIGPLYATLLVCGLFGTLAAVAGYRALHMAQTLSFSAKPKDE